MCCRSAHAFFALGKCLFCFWKRGSTAMLLAPEPFSFGIIALSQPRAPLAQLDRASGYEPEGREFESLRARHFRLVFRLRSPQPEQRKALHRVYREPDPAYRATQLRHHQVNQESRSVGLAASGRVCQPGGGDAPREVSEVRPWEGSAEAYLANAAWYRLGWIESAAGGNQKAGSSNLSGRAITPQ